MNVFIAGVMMVIAGGLISFATSSGGRLWVGMAAGLIAYASGIIISL